MPKRKLEPLTEQSACFVGVEPEMDAKANNAKYLGMPFCLGNAFMGSEPGHPFWVHCMKGLELSHCKDVVDATGPRFVNSIALTVPRADRPRRPYARMLVASVWHGQASTDVARLCSQTRKALHGHRGRRGVLWFAFVAELLAEPDRLERAEVLAHPERDQMELAPHGAQADG